MTPPCLVCGAGKANTIHGDEPPRKDGRRPAAFVGTVATLRVLFFYHAYDPGERRREERRILPR